MYWLSIQDSLFDCQAKNDGRVRTFGEILLTDVAVPHHWCYKAESGKWIEGISNDLETIIELKSLSSLDENYKERKAELKPRLQCFTPAALFTSKQKGSVQELKRTYLMQIDFDEAALHGYDLEELKKAVFGMRFVAFCGLSCSGKGFYILILISDPNKLGDYAQHCFEVFKKKGIAPDESKGRKPENLRYLSYDCNMLIRDYPEPLEIKNFYTKSAPKKDISRLRRTSGIEHSNKLLRACLDKIAAASIGNRWQTVQNVAYTLGGINKPELLVAIKHAITLNHDFSGEEPKYFKCAEDCFADGSLKPLIKI